MKNRDIAHYELTQEEIRMLHLEEEETKSKQTNSSAQNVKSTPVTSIDGKHLIVQGVVDEIKKGNSKYGYSYRIYVNGQCYFFNCKTEGAVFQLFEVGKKCAFQFEMSKEFKKITQVFYSF
jgi:hypothetical protein